MMSSLVCATVACMDDLKTSSRDVGSIVTAEAGSADTRSPPSSGISSIRALADWRMGMRARRDFAVTNPTTSNYPSRAK